MNGKWPVLLIFCAFALSACAGVFGPGQEVSEGLSRVPLTSAERQQVDCQARLGKVEGVGIEQRQGCVVVTFRCDTLFEHGADRIVPGACGLSDLADILNIHHETLIRVDAHTDCMRSEEENLEISEMRAGAVKEALVVRGVSASRITARGWGESKPAASNTTEAGRRANRRVSVSLLPPSL